jgi:hypothetical protein
MDNFDLRKYLAEGRLFESQPYDDKTRKNEAEGLAADIELEGGKKQRFISDFMKATKGESWDTFYDIADEIMGKYLTENKLLRENSKSLNLTDQQKQDFIEDIKYVADMEDEEYAMGEAGNILSRVLSDDNDEIEFLEDIEKMGYDVDEVETLAIELASEAFDQNLK